MSWKDTHFTYLSINRENAQKLKERAESDSSSSLAVQSVWLNPVTDIFPSISQTTRRSCTFCNNCFYLGGRGRIWVRHQWKTAIRGNFFFSKVGLGLSRQKQAATGISQPKAYNKFTDGMMLSKAEISVETSWKKNYFILSITFANIQVIS